MSSQDEKRTDDSVMQPASPAGPESVAEHGGREAAPVEERVDTALDTVEQLADIIDTMVAKVAGLDALTAAVNRLEPLIARVTQLEKALADKQQQAREHQRVYRFELREPKTPVERAKVFAEIEDAWDQLATWVAWFVHTYRLTDSVPTCWPAHPVVREELMGFRVAWAGAWTDSTARHDAVVVFHEQVWRLRERMRDPNWGAPRCTGTHHDSGFDGEQDYQEWAADPAGAKAFEAAVMRTLDALPVLEGDPE